MTFCEVTDRISDTVFDRDIDFRGQRFTERITMEEPHRVTFTRIAGPVLGTIANEIEGPDDDLRLRFSFALVVAGRRRRLASRAGVRRLDDRRLPQGGGGHAGRHAAHRGRRGGVGMTDIAAPAIIDDELRARIAQQLDGQFKGDIIGPDHAEYESARQVWNAMVDRRPGLILRCTSTADVVAAVNVAREYDLAPSVRCGGHNVAGKGMSEGGLTLDLSGLREVSVDPENKLVHVGGGSRLGDVDAVTSQHGLIVPAGIMSETGVAGLSLAAASAGSPARTG